MTKLMKFYDPRNQGTYSTMAEGRIVSTDPRVASWYEPLPDNYERDYDAEGYPLLIPFILDDAGNRYSHYMRVGLENVPDLEKIEASAAEALYTSAHTEVCEWLEWCDLQETLIRQGSSRAYTGLTMANLYSFAEALRDHTTHEGEVVGAMPNIDDYI